jgi:hypothetical protein
MWSWFGLGDKQSPVLSKAELRMREWVLSHGFIRCPFLMIAFQILS